MLYRNNLKNRDFDKEVPQNSCPERATIAERQGASEGKSFEVKPTQSKTDSSGCFGIKQPEVPSRFEIWKMFDQISPTYDAVNRLMTFGIDLFWRRKMCSFLPSHSDLQILDVATGTGDQIIALMQSQASIERIVGVDLAEAMLELGRKKLAAKPYANQVELIKADALSLPFAENSFDCVTISFGIRNVIDTQLCLQEIHRVLKPGGRLLILEGSIPKHSFVKQLYLFYMRHLMPRVGGLISSCQKAYTYLNQTIETFPSGQAFCLLLSQAGFGNVIANPLNWGTVTIYQGDKK